MRLHHLSFVLLSLILSARADVLFTVEATVSSIVEEPASQVSALGYTNAQSLTLTFQLRDISSNLSGNAVAASNYTWFEETISQETLWHSVGGTGLNGTWTVPSSASDSPYSLVKAGAVLDGASELSIIASTDTFSGNETGISANGLPVHDILINAKWLGLNFSIPDNTLPGTGYFLNYIGSYDAASAGTSYIGTRDSITSNITSAIILNPTKLTISLAAIPEPSTWALFGLGLGVIWLAVRRRRVS